MNESLNTPSQIFEFVPDFCEKVGVKTFALVFLGLLSFLSDLMHKFDHLQVGLVLKLYVLNHFVSVFFPVFSGYFGQFFECLLVGLLHLMNHLRELLLLLLIG